MSVQAIGAVDNAQPKQKKSNTGRVLVGTAVSAGGGALLGNYAMDHFLKECIQDAKDMLDPTTLKHKTRMSLVGKSNMTEEAFEAWWKVHGKSQIETAKSSAEEILKTVKKAKTKWTLIGAGAAAGLTLLISAISNKKAEKA
ncbi:MAG: hypothetical protein E7Z92_00175 [Cyanobacteria bacterium SIG31]|nr:hypothetical protein [Cyanobacteria bacterium SIG31]